MTNRMGGLSSNTYNSARYGGYGGSNSVYGAGSNSYGAGGSNSYGGNYGVDKSGYNVGNYDYSYSPSSGNGYGGNSGAGYGNYGGSTGNYVKIGKV